MNVCEVTQEQEREWEVWDEEESNFLRKLWGPADKRGGRHWLLMRKIAGLVSGNEVLDVGCGQGHLYSQLEDVNYIGLDNSIEMLGIARRNFPGEEERFKYGDVYDLSYFDTKNTVTCISVLIHLPEVTEPLKELWNRTEKHLIVTFRLGNGVKTLKRPHKDGKFLIIHFETIENIYKTFSRLDELSKIERYYFDPKTEIFKLTKGVMKI